ncbi:MAG: hypothetical protein ACP5I4_12010 [Oceanipulchritudo sp.]|jgi:hypothetical protein
MEIVRKVTRQTLMQPLQWAMFLFLVLVNLCLVLGILGANCLVQEMAEAGKSLLGASLPALAGSAYLGLRIHRYPHYLNFNEARAVYVPGILLSVLLPFLAVFFFSRFLEESLGAKVMLTAGSLFLVICQLILLNTKRHAFSYSLTETLR